MEKSWNCVFEFLKSVCATVNRPFAEVGGKSPLQLSSQTRGTVLSLQTSLSLARNMNVTVAKELYYIFYKILKFRCW